MFDQRSVCVGCGKSFDEITTVWYKMYQTYLKIVPFYYRPMNIWLYKIRPFFKRYNTVKPRTLKNDWIDRDQLLIHVIFEVLCEFVEKELIPGPVDWEADKNHSHAKREMLDLYEWWGSREWDFDNLPQPKYDKWLQEADGNSFIAENNHRDFVLKQCERVIRVSPYMWT